MKKKISLMKYYAIFETVCLIILLVLLGIGVEAAIAGEYMTTLWFGIGAVGCGAGIFAGGKLLAVKLKSQGIYRLNLAVKDIETITDRFQAAPIEPQAYIAFEKIGKIKTRLLIQNCEEFDASELSNRRKKLNQKCNKMFSTPAKASAYDLAVRLRVNLVVCQKYTPELERWVGRNSEQLLTRAESVVNSAACLEDGVLLFPDCAKSLLLKDVRRYEAAAQLLCDRLTET